MAIAYTTQINAIWMYPAEAAVVVKLGIIARAAGAFASCMAGATQYFEVDGVVVGYGLVFVMHVDQRARRIEQQESDAMRRALPVQVLSMRSQSGSDNIMHERSARTI